MVDAFDPGSTGGEPDNLGGTRSLRGKFLLASASLLDYHFNKTVVLILRHDEDGALGLVLNRPLGVTLEEACSDDVESARGVNVMLFHGGPCEGPLVAIHNVSELADGELEEPGFDEEQEPWSEQVSEGVWFCRRREALEALMRHVRETIESEKDGIASQTKTAVKFVAGYAGWETGQLERELVEGSWLVAEAAPDDIYAGGSPGYPTPPATTSLPASAIGLVALLAHAIEGKNDPLPGLAAGVRQWVRLSTRANISRMVDPRLIPPDPASN